MSTPGALSKNRSRERWRAKGLCVCCGAKRDSELLRCSPCLDKNKLAAKRYYQKARPLVSCNRCSAPSRGKLCQKCAAALSLLRRAGVKDDIRWECVPSDFDEREGS
jgi:hypothetical protein